MIRHFCNWLGATPLSATLQQVAWAIPLLQVIHILGIAVAFSSICLIAARLAGLNRHTVLEEVLRRNLRLFWPSTAILLASGSLLIISEPKRDLLNPIFWLKMATLVVGLTSVYVFANKIPRSKHANTAIAVGLVVVWTTIIVCGRWIAYFDSGAN